MKKKRLNEIIKDIDMNARILLLEGKLKEEKMTAELSLKKVDSSETTHGDLKGILKAPLQSRESTQHFLGFGGKQTIAPRLIDLNETINGSLKMLRSFLGENINLTWLPGRGLGAIMIDPSQLALVLTNLCLNARDAITDVGKVTIKTDKVTFDKTYCNDLAGFSCAPGDFVLLAVSDNGTGMNKKIQDNIFEPFFTTKKVGKGTGLGLFTVYGIVKQNGGFINFCSEPDKGTSFKIYLKCYEEKTIDVCKRERGMNHDRQWRDHPECG